MGSLLPPMAPVTQPLSSLTAVAEDSTLQGGPVPLPLSYVTSISPTHAASAGAPAAVPASRSSRQGTEVTMHWPLACASLWMLVRRPAQG